MRFSFGFENNTKILTFTSVDEGNSNIPQPRGSLNETVVELSLEDYIGLWPDAFLRPWKYIYDDIGLVPVLKEGA